MKNIYLFLLAVLFTAFGAVAQNLQVTQIAGASALVSWDNDPAGTVSFFSLEYAEEGQDNGVFVSNITGTSYMLSPLNPLTRYVVHLQANYNDNTVSEWSTISFITGCLAGGENAVGNGTSTSDFLPSHSLYQYGYSQQIFTAAEIGSAGNIYSLSLEMSYVSRPRRYKIYLMHTTATTVSTWLPADSAQLVFDAEQDLVEGWNTFHFSAPFAYNGTDNLVLIFVDNSNVIGAVSLNRSIVHTAYSYCTRYIYNNNTPFDINTIPSSPGTPASVRNNVIFGGICDTTVTCIVPNIYVDHVSDTSADVIWVPGYDENAWELEYAFFGDSLWTSITNPTGGMVTLYQLDSHTRYKVRMRAVCASGQVSEWAMTDFTTECAKISIPFFEDFNSINTTGSISTWIPACWIKYDCFSTFYPIAGNPNHGGAGGLSLNFCSTPGTYNIAVMPEANIDVSSLEVSFFLRVNKLTNGMTVGVMTESDDFDGFVPVDTVFCTETNTFQHQAVDLDTYLGTGKFIAFKNCNDTHGNLYLDDVNVTLIPSCPYPHHIVVTDIYKDSAVIAWTERGSATEWILEYGPSGFTPGSGTTVQTTQNPYTLTGLYAGTGYDVYVRSDCEGNMSDWCPDHASFTTRNCTPAHQCEYYFVCIDSYGDGWNGAYVSIQQNGLSIATVENTTHATSGSSTMIDTVAVMLCDNMNTTIIWHAGGTYDYEASLIILSPAGDTVYTHTNMSTVGSNTLLNFITDCDGFIPYVCEMPLYVNVDSIGGNSADISWTAGYVETEWNLQYKEAVATSWSESIPLTSAHYQIPNLMSETEYQVRVQANCIDTLSDWTNPVSFTTQSGGIDSVDTDSVGVAHHLLAQSICLRPNPADNYIELSVNGHIEVKEALVFNVFGQLIQTVQLIDNHARIDLSRMTAGIYFVRISNTGATKKFIKR